MAYVCNDLQTIDLQTNQGLKTFTICTSYQDIGNGYKLTNEQMGSFILSIALMFAVAAVFRIIKRSIF